MKRSALVMGSLGLSNGPDQRSVIRINVILPSSFIKVNNYPAFELRVVKRERLRNLTSKVNLLVQVLRDFLCCFSSERVKHTRGPRIRACQWKAHGGTIRGGMK